MSTPRKPDAARRHPYGYYIARLPMGQWMTAAQAAPIVDVEVPNMRWLVLCAYRDGYVERIAKKDPKTHHRTWWYRRTDKAIPPEIVEGTRKPPVFVRREPDEDPRNGRVLMEVLRDAEGWRHTAKLRSANPRPR